MNISRQIFSSIIFAFAAITHSGCVATEARVGLESGMNHLGGTSSVIRFDYSPSEIRSLCELEKNKILKALDAVAAIDPENAMFENALLGIETSLIELVNNLEPANFLKYVSPDAEKREAAGECEELISKLYVDIFTREDLYNVVRAVRENTKQAGAKPLGETEHFLLEEYLSDFRRNGLELPAEERKKFIEKKKRLVELTTEFSKNLNEWKDPLKVSRAELDGLSDDYISGLEKEGDQYIVTLSYPHYYPFMENAKNSEARKKLQHKFFNRGGDRNRELLEEAISLRSELAKMLGYDSHAKFVLEKRMAKSPDKVFGFLKNLITKLQPKGREDLRQFVELKKEELGTKGDVQLDPWDWRYYANQLKKKKYSVDQEVIREYFPLDVVNKGMFEIYEKLLGVEFEATKDVPTWHESVLAYSVKRQGEVVAYFFMDLYPREGKYKHAAAFTLQKGYLKKGGKYHVPVSSIVANFSPPIEGQPSLLMHGQVETHFHEFGHIMHQILTNAPYGSLSGTSVKRDFVEAPSQMLENWVWKKESLAKLSGHYKDPSKPLPKELLDKLVAAKLANVGITSLRQLFFGMLDMTYHTSESVNSTEIYRQLAKEIMLIPIPDGTQPQASFGHLMGGYDSGYYGYMWSNVYAEDMFTRFDAEGLLNAQTGADYRKWILEPGGTKDPFDLIKGFLGREPNEKAFLKSLGLS